MHDAFNDYVRGPPIYASWMMISGGRTEKYVITGFGELAAVDQNT